MPSNGSVRTMKSPRELVGKLSRQWQQADWRESRLLSTEAWPIVLGIGKPSASAFSQDTAQVREHVQDWRAVRVGEVIWEPVNYRSGSAPVEVPVQWVLKGPSEWISAIDSEDVRREYTRLERLVSAADARFHTLLLRQRHLLQDKPEEEVIKAMQLTLMLQPGCAKGKPLRALGTGGIDSKFFERHRALMVQLLDCLFDGQVSELGLESFLGALDEGNHWLLVAPLQTGLLPFQQQRVRASELMNAILPGTHVLLVENEQCLHQLPELPDTVAILGAGMNLSWMSGQALNGKQLGYWGDLDTWGLVMLSKVRQLRPDVRAILMDQSTFLAHESRAVEEPSPAHTEPPAELLPHEVALYQLLASRTRGRLEQEFLPSDLVLHSLHNWQFNSVPRMGSELS
ncbi:MAG: Wadjet anti-phage system protein JetD domain-containing protein [Pseudomonadota bacterium]